MLSPARFNGGGVQISSGSGAQSAGSVSIVVGLSTGGVPGVLSLSGGTTNGAGVTGGAVNIFGGDASAGTGAFEEY